MYVLQNEALYALRAIAMLVVVALVLWTAGFSAFIQSAEASNVTQFSDLLTDSAPTEASNHTITFTIPNGMQIGETLIITMPGGSFVFDNIILDDIDIATNTVDATLALSAGAGIWGVGTTSTQMTFTTPTDIGVVSGTVIEVQIGTNATFGPTGINQITNPAAGSYEITVTGTMQDDGRTRVAIVDNVLVTADVSTTFIFVISGRATSTTANGTSTTLSTSATTIPFGNLTAGEIKTAAQQLQVTTNAANGFVVTVEQDNNLQSSTGADIDGFIDGAYTDTPAGWAAPTQSVADEDTWGHWGLTSEDNLNGDEFGAGDVWVAASTTPRQVFTHASSSDGSTDDIGSTTVAYQVEITALQEAGDDYQTILTYIATPTF